MDNQFILDFSCVNCEASIPWLRKRKVYCGNFCREETSTIRWIRSTIIRGIADRPDVADTRRLRLAWLNSGGYSTTGRQISNALRAFIVKKYNKKCALCGVDNSGTHEIDHIQGSSNSPNNLQLLCLKCHRAKSMSNIVTISEDASRRVEIDAQFLKLAKKRSLRISHPIAKKPCDDPENWTKICKAMELDRKREYFSHLLRNYLKPMLDEKLHITHLKNHMNDLEIPIYSGFGKWSRKSVRSMLDELGVRRIYDSSSKNMEYFIPTD